MKQFSFIYFFHIFRRYSGGFHANSFGGCIFCSVTIYLVYIKILYPILLRNILLNMFMLVFSLFIVLIFVQLIILICIGI